MLRRTITVAAGALAVGAGVGACGGDEQPAPSSKAAAAPVQIKTFIFRPDPLRVRAGTKVSWANQDDILHTVTSGGRDRPSGLFDEKLERGDRFGYTFRTPGRYRYVCTIHMGMDGTVIVS